MTEIKALYTLIKEMKPQLSGEEYVFYSMPVGHPILIELNPLLIFREKESMTYIIEKAMADTNEIPYNDVWRLITLSVCSDLTAIGFLAVITKILAEAQISVNIVSAYYHDHLFVPTGMAIKAMKVLDELSKIK